jgi:hypothetical protein
MRTLPSQCSLDNRSIIRNVMYKIIFLLIAISSFTLSQENQIRQTGFLEGIVLNAVTKEPIAGATAVLQGTTIGAATDDQGKFKILNIPVGTYGVRVSSVGFEPKVKTDVVIATGKQTKIVVELPESLFEFESVTVTGEYFAKSPDAPISIQTLGAEEIRRLPGGFEDVVRAISILPGVAQVQAGRNDLIVRGGAPSENLFVIDNIEVFNINHFGTQGASGGPLSYVNLDFVNETAFKTGGFGAKYGDKLSSVLTIDLRDGRTDRFGGKATLSASQFGLNLEGPINERGSFLFSARRSYLDFIFKAAGFSFVPEYWDFLGKVNYTITPKDQFTLLSLVVLDDIKYFNDTSEKLYDNSRILGNAQNQFIGGATWRHLLNHGFTTVTLSQTYTRFSFQQHDSLWNPIFRSASDEYETSLRADVVYQIQKETEISFGAVAKYISFASNITLSSFWTNFGQNLSVSSSLDTTALKSAGYVQLVQSLSHNVRLVAGGRIDYFNLFKNNVVFSPRVSLSYTATPLLTFNASIGIYHQAPSYIWLVANPVNRNLTYIRVQQYIAGAEYLLDADVKISVEGYRKNYSAYPVSAVRTYLVMANTGAGFGGSEDGYASFGLDPLLSAGAGTAHGVEFFLQKRLSDVPYYGLISVSYNESRFKALDGISRPNAFDQRWIVNFGGGYILNELWEFAGKFRFATGRPYTPYNTNGTQNVAAYNSERVGINHSLDIRIDRRWNFTNWNLITYIDVQNVYNRKPHDVPLYDERTGKLKESDAIGLLPSIGITAEF